MRYHLHERRHDGEVHLVRGRRKARCVAAAGFRGALQHRLVHIPEGGGLGAVAGIPWRYRVFCVGVCLRSALVARVVLLIHGVDVRRLNGAVNDETALASPG